MSTWLLWVVGICYIGTAIDLWWHGNPGLGLAFAAYAVANFGLIWAAKAPV